MDSTPGVRADIWLWAARMFKTRRLCREAIDGGRVALNGVACKPAKQIHAGDHLRVSRGEERLELAVLALSDKRGPASSAQTLYAETEASMAAREKQREISRMQGPSGPKRRPDKASRRELRRLKHGN